MKSRPAEKKKSYGEFWLRMTLAGRAATVITLQEIKTAGKTVSEVWAKFQAHQKEVSAQATATPMPYADVVAEFGRRKLAAGKSWRYIDECAGFFARFGAGRE